MNRQIFKPLSNKDLKRFAKRPHNSSPNIKQNRKSWFLKGPIPLLWLQVAAKLPGKSLNVGIALWFLSGLTKKRTVALKSSHLIKFGVCRGAKQRCLASLEKAGLVLVKRKRGKSPEVTIIDIEQAAEKRRSLK